MKKYIIQEDKLVKLIADHFALMALENGGVDNWSWYGDSLNQFLNEMEADEFEEAAVNHINSFAMEME